MEIRAYAKINLTLEVLGPRSDGYHDVTTVIQTIDLADRLRFVPSRQIELECSTPGLGGEDNLVWKAARAMCGATGREIGLKIILEKHIPVGMGLGGGSSDAAATLIAINHLWELDMSGEELKSVASSLGSDVPFFFQGGTTLGQGRGDDISHLPPLPQRWVVLLCPVCEYADLGPAPPGKTARLYSMLTPEHYTGGSHTSHVVDSMRKGYFRCQDTFNVFEAVASSAFLGLDRARREFLEAGVSMATLSGAGPALYALVSGQEEGEAVLEALKRRGWEGYCVSTIQPGGLT